MVLLGKNHPRNFRHSHLSGLPRTYEKLKGRQAILQCSTPQVFMARKLTRKKSEELYAILSTASPSPRTELNYSNTYTLLVAVTLSAQATDEGVNRATGPLFAKIDNPEAMVALGEKELGEHVKTIGLWRNKAKNVIALSKILVDDYDGGVPETREELEALPGVGRKTANVVMNVAYGAPTIAVDTHIFRVSNRTGLAPGANPLAVEEALLKVTPEQYALNAHHWLILHGRYICKARKPECGRCQIESLCLFKDKTTSSPPAKKAPRKKTIRKKKTVKSKTAKKKAVT